MSFKAATLFQTDEPIAPLLAALDPWGAPGKDQLASVGLLPQFEPQTLGNQGLWFKVRISERKPVKSDLKLRIAELPSELKGADKVAKIEEMTLEAIRATRPTHQTIDVVVHGEWVIVFHATANTVDTVTSWMRTQSEDKLGMKLYQPDDANFTELVQTMMGETSLEVGEIAVGGKFELVDDHGKGNKRKITVTSTHNDHDERLTGMGARAQQITQCTLMWRDFTAVFSTDWTLRGITCEFTDVEYDDAENDLQRATTEAYYLARQLPEFVKAVVDTASTIGEF